MNYFPETTYWRPLVANAESMYEKNNPYFKNLCTPSVVENKADFIMVKINKYASVYLC